MTTSEALGLVETVGLAAATEAADAMVKAANVRIVTRQQPGGVSSPSSCAGMSGP